MISEGAHLCRTHKRRSCARTWRPCMGTCPFPPCPPPPLPAIYGANLQPRHYGSCTRRFGGRFRTSTPSINPPTGPDQLAEPARPAAGRFVIRPTPKTARSAAFFRGLKLGLIHRRLQMGSSRSDCWFCRCSRAFTLPSRPVILLGEKTPRRRKPESRVCQSRDPLVPFESALPASSGD